MDSFSVSKELNGIYRVFDIGSNTLLMLIVECKDGNINILEDDIQIARLGEGLAATGYISDTSLERAKSIIEDYKVKSKKYKIVSTVALATAAVREASNSENVQKTLESFLGSQLSIISSQEEARLSYHGTFGLEEKGSIIDIGGGSTEFATLQVGNIKGISIPIGAVKIKELFLHSDPPQEDEISKAREYIFSKFKEFGILEKYENVHAVAGTPVTLAGIAQNLKGYDFDKLHGFCFTKDKLNETVELTLKSTSQTLKDKLGGHPHRSDIISSGGLILDSFVKYCSIDELKVNCLGLRFGPLVSPEGYLIH
ncbi:MAG: bifunctional 3-dehydroquinate synthase/phosphatase [Candidatus Kapaibacteriales bacterium]